VQYGKWEVLAGQEWSLLTPNRVGLSPLTPDVFVTLDEDPNFQVGLTWARQAQVRVVYHLQATGPLAYRSKIPSNSCPDRSSSPRRFQYAIRQRSGSTSAASSATNTAVPNLHPDIIVNLLRRASSGSLTSHRGRGCCAASGSSTISRLRRPPIRYRRRWFIERELRNYS